MTQGPGTGGRYDRVFRDSAFADAVTKTNLTAILEQYRDDVGVQRIKKIRSL